MLTGRLIVIAAAFLLDLCLGDPAFLYHPVCAIGTFISFLTKKLLPLCGKEKKKERAAGLLLVLLVTAVSTSIPLVFLFFAYHFHRAAGILLESFWCYQLLAMKDLRVESSRVADALSVSLKEGRKAVSMIVGRDTQSLDAEGVIRAAVETVAENTSDGVVAPLLFMALFGAAGGFFYKAVNTMDSMVGYQNEKYQYFGTVAAKLDDVCNFIPARLSAVFMILAAGILQAWEWIAHGQKGRAKKENGSEGKADINAVYSMKNAWRIWRRDRYNHKSPNSAQTESVCAGALQIRLAGDASYFGKLHKKPTIGDAVRPIETEDIHRAGRLMYVTSTLAWLFCFLGILSGMLF